MNTEKQKLADRTGQKEKRMGGGGVGAASRLGSANDVSSRELPQLDQLGRPTVQAVGLALKYLDAAEEREQTLRIADCF